MLMRGGVVSRGSLRQEERTATEKIKTTAVISGLRQYSENLESSEYIVENYIRKLSNGLFF